MNQLAARPVSSRLTHALAIVTVVAALPLVLLGAEVTTKGVGMVDPQSVRSPFLFLTEWMNQHDMGWLIEHGHRQVGWIVGMLAIATVIAAFVFDGRGWVKALAVAALLGVCVQGLLGIFRIQLNATIGPAAAQVHGAFAPIVLSLLLTMALASARGWSLSDIALTGRRRVRLFSALLVVAVYLQIVLGGFLRHRAISGDPDVADRIQLLGGRLHSLQAFVVFGLAFLLIKTAREADRNGFFALSRVMEVLLALQILLGVEAWIAWLKRFFNPGAAILESTMMQLTRSAHYVVGAFLFAVAVAFAVKAFCAPATFPQTEVSR